jgi:hypothetical protein
MDPRFHGGEAGREHGGPHVIPANAGIHSANLGKRAAYGLDSRFHGNDRRFVKDAIPIDTTTSFQRLLT